MMAFSPLLTTRKTVWPLRHCILNAQSVCLPPMVDPDKSPLDTKKVGGEFNLFVYARA